MICWAQEADQGQLQRGLEERKLISWHPLFGLSQCAPCMWAFGRPHPLYVPAVKSKCLGKGKLWSNGSLMGAMSTQEQEPELLEGLPMWIVENQQPRGFVRCVRVLVLKSDPQPEAGRAQGPPPHRISSPGLGFAKSWKVLGTYAYAIYIHIYIYVCIYIYIYICTYSFEKSCQLHPT